MIELYSITYYILIVLLLIVGMIGYLKLAEKWSIIDKPNSRSSHNYNTKRGGGVLYLLGFIIYLYFSKFNNQFIITNKKFSNNDFMNMGEKNIETTKLTSIREVG